MNLNFPPQSFAQVLVGWQNWLGAPTATVGRWRTAPPTRWVRTAASWRPARPVRVTALGATSFLPLDCNRPGPKLRVQLFGPGEISGRREPQPFSARICRRFRCFCDDHSGRRPGDRLCGRRLSAWRRSNVGDHARARRGARHCGTGGHRLSVASGSPRWCSGTSKHPVRHRQRPAGSARHIKRCNRIRLAAM